MTFRDVYDDFMGGQRETLEWKTFLFFFNSHAKAGAEEISGDGTIESDSLTAHAELDKIVAEGMVTREQIDHLENEYKMFDLNGDG